MEVKLKEIQYRQDVLGAGYECADLEFPTDYEGKVIATLIRKKAQKSAHKAVGFEILGDWKKLIRK